MKRTELRYFKKFQNIPPKKTKKLNIYLNQSQKPMKTLTFKIALIFAMMAAGSALAQPQQVTGTVKDATGVPIIGAAVTVEGTSLGVLSGIDGSFAIQAADGTVLVASYLGYEPQRVTVGGGKNSLRLRS